MTQQPFGEDLWKNLQSVKVSKEGGIEVPVRADHHGIRVGVDTVASAPVAEPRRPGRIRTLLRRLRRT